MNQWKKVNELFKQFQNNLRVLKQGINTSGAARDTLDFFILHLGLEISSETRYAAYMRLSELKEDALIGYMETQNYTQNQKNILLEKAYNYIKIYYFDAYNEIITSIKKQNILSDFYLQILESHFEIGQAITDWNIAWKKHIIQDINVWLEKKFDNNAHKIIEFLEQNNLLEKTAAWEIADRSYSTLILEEDRYIKKSYAEVFVLEIARIVLALENTIKKLSKNPDEEYGKQKEFIAYFDALKNAFWETNCDQLIGAWQQVDIAWMHLETPLQIGHPLEFYEDIYRKCVAPEWDLRLQDDSILKSDIYQDVHSMYNKLYAQVDQNKYVSSYNYSLENMKRVQLYISQPLSVFGSGLSWMFSAQVVPNDDMVSAQYGKKIFAYPEFVLEWQKNAPQTLLNTQTFSPDFLEKYDVVLSDADLYYKIYDIETIGHEFGHTLWLDIGVESQMNGWWNFKNIEEFKATSGGLMAYFETWDTLYDEAIFVTHIFRCIRMLKYSEVIDVVPYYCECLIHLDILLSAGVISFLNTQVAFHHENIPAAKLLYKSTYQKLIQVYLDRQDANRFLYQYIDQKGKEFFAKNTTLDTFVQKYYSEYKRIGNKTL